ncbi:MAG: Hydroperoxy fatty acid reductase 1 [Fibrobacterota bacterium]|jgi:glutathione peroxidase
MRRFDFALAATLACAVVAVAAPKDALDFRVKDIDGTDVDLGQWRGKVVLVVNTASKCGHTPQYTGLQKLWTEQGPKGLVVLGFPSNDFLWQEPGTSKEIKEFCSLKYRVTFPMFEKIEVKGKDAAPLYAYLSAQDAMPKGAGKVSWNFEKFLIGRDGKVAARFAPSTQPEDPEVTAAIAKELAKPVP